MYDRQKAVDYALTWAINRNPKFYDFSSLGGDCTNFISQCMYYGGFTQNYNQNGWFYVDIDRRSPSWTGVNEFWNFAINNDTNFGVKLKLCTLNELEVGDVIQLYNGNRYYHNLIVTNLSNGIRVSAHTSDQKNVLLSNYYYQSLRCGKAVIY